MKWADRTQEDRAAINKKHEAIWRKNGYVKNYEPAITRKSKILIFLGILSAGLIVGVALTVYFT